MRICLNVNGARHEIDVPPRTTLLAALRDDLGLTGSHYGCGQGVCGACYVLADGIAVASCTLFVEDAVALNIITVEGLAQERLHPVQQAFVEEDAMQCGYCTPGMIISAVALLSRVPKPTEQDIRQCLGSHLCRCGIYGRAIRAVGRAGR